MQVRSADSAVGNLDDCILWCCDHRLGDRIDDHCLGSHVLAGEHLLLWMLLIHGGVHGTDGVQLMETQSGALLLILTVLPGSCWAVCEFR